MQEDIGTLAPSQIDKSDSILETIRLIGIVAILMALFLFALASIILQAENINAFGQSLGFPQYHNPFSVQSAQFLVYYLSSN